MSVLARIRAHGGDVTRDEWRLRLAPGRLTPEAVAWVAARRDQVAAEVWPDFDAWVERAAILEHCAGMDRAAAEAAAYRGLPC